MSKLAAIKKQIAALEAQAERIAKQEMSGAIAKVKEIMLTFGLTIENLQSAVAGQAHSAERTKPRRAGGGRAKYADPQTGKVWSGFGRAPGWIAGVKNRDAFLVDKSGIEVPEKVAKAVRAKKEPASKAASAKKVMKPAAKRGAAVAKRAAAAAGSSPAVAKKPSANKASPKPVAKKSARKRAASRASGAQSPAASAVPLAT